MSNRTSSRGMRQAHEVAAARWAVRQWGAAGAATIGVILAADPVVRLMHGLPSSVATVTAVGTTAAAGLAAVTAWRWASWENHGAKLGLMTAVFVYAAGTTRWGWIAAALLLLAAWTGGFQIGTALGVNRRVLPPALRRAAAVWAGCVALGFAMAPLLALVWLPFGGSRVLVLVSSASAVLAAGCAPPLRRHLADDEMRATERASRRADPALVELRGLEVHYGPVQVLFGVDLDVHAGEIVGLLGTNGAGKSTVLKTAAGFLRPTRGTVRLAGEEVTGLLPEELVERGIVLVPGGRAVFPDLTVAENLRMAGFLESDQRVLDETTARVYELFPSLRARMATRAGELSGGEQQMLAIAQALYAKPKVLMIDELSLGLAPVIVAQLLATVRAIASQGVAIVLVEQSVNVALSVTERSVFMEKGEVRFVGPTAALLDRPDVLRSVFLAGEGTAQELATI